MKIKLINLSRQYQIYKKEIDQAIQSVLLSGNFILGKEVDNFEKDFAKFCGAKYCIGLASGTDALFLSLKALGIGAGDEVITVPNSFIATALCISMTGAKPVFIDIDPDTYNIDIKKIVAKINFKTKAIIPVHLYGQPADMDNIKRLAKKYSLFVLEDACQAHGAYYRNTRVGALGQIAAFSFNPPKNLGCYGDGGAVVTNDSSLAKKVLLYREYGSKKKYLHLIKGFNSRLDALQAAILSVKLKHLDTWNISRSHNCRLYDQLLAGLPIVKPTVLKNARPVWHQYVIRTKRRKALMKYLGDRQISTMIHYPVPIHLQPAYKDLGYKRGDFPVTEAAAGEILSLPVCPQLKDEEIRYVAKNIAAFFKK